MRPPPTRTVRRGDTLPFLLALETDEAGQPWQSFAGYRLSFTVKTHADDTDAAALIRLTSDLGGGITTGQSASWVMSAADLQAGARYFYDVQLERVATGVVLTLEAGLILVSADVTHSTLQSP